MRLYPQWAEIVEIDGSSLLLTLSQPAAEMSLDWKIRLLRYWFHRVYLAHYQGLLPFGVGELARWRPVVAAARISEGVPEEGALLALVMEELNIEDP